MFSGCGGSCRTGEYSDAEYEKADNVDGDGGDDDRDNMVM